MCRPPGEGGEQLDDLPTDPEAIRTALRLGRSVTHAGRSVEAN
jgi:hypothetical protein